MQHALFDLLHGTGQIPNAFDHQVCSGCQELFTDLRMDTRSLLRGERFHVGARLSQQTPGERHSYRPHSCVQSLFDVHRRIADLDQRSHGVHSQAHGVHKAHPWRRASGRNIIGADDAIGSIAVRSGSRGEGRHHCAQVAGCRANFDSAFAQFCCGFDHAGDWFGVLFQNRCLQRNELFEQVIDVGFRGWCAMHRLPRRSDRWAGEDGAQVVFFHQSHACSRVFWCYHNTTIGKQAQKYCGRRK